MDVHVDRLETDVTVTDEVLSPAELNRLVEAVLQRWHAMERARSIVDRNTQIARSAASRPDLLRS
jgi:hypothetical protein